MASPYTVETAVHATFASTAVEQVTFNGFARYIQVVNRDSSIAIYLTMGKAPATPTAAGDDTLVVMPNSTLTIAYPTDCAGGDAVVKLIPASGTPAYSVQLIPDRN